MQEHAELTFCPFDVPESNNLSQKLQRMQLNIISMPSDDFSAFFTFVGS